ncbi:MAG TPA: protein-export chaperone SecB [Candidatus Megaira endosymbiont of Nemacystus decipiens]|nr:protein-export chaperone SecB [Candidatus Megaera endosymbiont of Nemacystus decipiens]
MENEDSKAPHISVQTQYLKDLSFENPNAPSSLATLDKSPKIDLSLDLKVQSLAEEGHFEVELFISSKATSEDKTLFVVDIKYAGVFLLSNIPEEQKEMLLAVHCPSILFPYARKIIADATQDGGFQPLMIDPVDFGVLYNKKMMEKEKPS